MPSVSTPFIMCDYCLTESAEAVTCNQCYISFCPYCVRKHDAEHRVFSGLGALIFWFKMLCLVGLLLTCVWASLLVWRIFG